MQVQIREIGGNWDRGYALHKHTLSSTYLGEDDNGRAQFDTTRSEPGEALFRLKYRSDWAQVAPLAAELNRSILPNLGKIGFIVPMPASNVRARQPVTELARELGRITGLPVFENLLVKNAAPGGEQLKDMHSKDEKAAALAGRFRIENEITNEGRWNVLLLDDLFDTGASMEAACTALRSYGKVGRIYVAALTWK